MSKKYVAHGLVSGYECQHETEEEYSKYTEAYKACRVMRDSWLHETGLSSLAMTAKPLLALMALTDRVFYVEGVEEI